MFIKIKEHDRWCFVLEEVTEAKAHPNSRRWPVHHMPPSSHHFLGHRIIPAPAQHLEPAAELPIEPSKRRVEIRSDCRHPQLASHHAGDKVRRRFSSADAAFASTDWLTIAPPTEHSERPTGPSPTSPASTCEPSKRPLASPDTTLGRERWFIPFKFPSGKLLQCQARERKRQRARTWTSES